MPNKTPDELNRELESADVTELDDEDLDSVAGGNVNCNNTSCCQKDEELAV